LKITVSATGGYFVGTQAMSLTELDHYLERTAANNPLSQQASIYGDKRASWEAMVQALNACQKHGIKPTPMMENRAVME
jgi:biopolymer transport protein ExbD